MAWNIDLNKASVDELQSIEGIDRNWAQKIVEYRDSHGAFRDWSDLEDIPGFSSRHVNMLKKGGANIGGKKAA